MSTAGRPPASPAVALWAGVDRLLDRAPSLHDLRAHRLHLLAARRRRSLGLPVPQALQREERVAAAFSLAAPLVLERVRAACDGPLVVLKGPELAASWPDPALRAANDVDILVLDAHAVQRRLLSAGFVPLGPPDPLYDSAHHLQPLFDRQLGVKVEVHRRLEWVEWSEPPSVDELMRELVPAAVGVDGVSALPPPQHALAVAAHSWSSLPFRRLADLVDLEVVLLQTDRASVERLAERCDLGHVWRTLVSAADSLFLDAPATWPLRSWASDMRIAREPTVLRTHIRRIAGPAWALAPRRAVGATAAALAQEVLPAAGEKWGPKGRRMRLAARNAFRRRSEHERDLLG